MKRRVEIIVALCLFLLPGAAAADFLIILKNGSEFTTPEYWHTYEELRFYYLGGTVGLNRSTIKKIVSLQPPFREEALPPDESSSSLPMGSSTPSPGGATGKSKPAAAETAGEEKVDIPAYKRKKDQMTAELDQLSEKVRQATRQKDQEAKTKALEELRQKSAQIYDLTDEVTKKNKGKLPAGWWDRP